MNLTPGLILGIIALYFLALISISLLTGRDSSNENFFTARKHSPWYLVAFGMIGASISGVSFISVPGEVGAGKFGYYQVVLGYLVGYFVIAAVLMPVYYRMNLVSIYTYLDRRFGVASYKTGSAFFLLSRTIGSALRLYLMAIVLQEFVTKPLFLQSIQTGLNLSPAAADGQLFFLTVFITIFLIWTYTFRGGIRTIVFTDTFQTLFLVSAFVLTAILLAQYLDLSLVGAFEKVSEGGYSKMFFFEDGWSGTKTFWKQFLGGAAICIAMSGLDQDIMQKNLTCKNLGEAQKNMFWFSGMLALVNLFALFLGAFLFIYAAEKGIEIPTRLVNGELKPATDLLYPTIALQHLPMIVGVLFVLGIIASTYASSDSALAALTTSFCIDFLNFEKRGAAGENTVGLRTKVHIGFSFLLLLVVLLFWILNDRTVIDLVLRLAGYTYGPLLGMFAFGLLTKRQVWDRLVPVVCIASPLLTYVVNANSQAWLGGYKFGYELLIFNGLVTFLGIWAISKNEKFH
ncbi:MAG: sodium:solute symporter [Bacteroidota bacterium]